MIKADVQLKDMGVDAQIEEVMAAIDANLKDVATFVRDEAKNTSQIADKTGGYRKSIKMRKSRFENGGYIVYSKDPKAHLLELGHVLIAWGKITGKRVRPFPIFRQAKDKGVRYAIARFRSANKR